MTVKKLNFAREEEVKKWDSFAAAAGRLYHHSYWAKILSSVYAFEPFYLYIENAGDIISVFPLCRVKLPLIKDELVSLPHIEACGIITPEYYSLYFDYIRESIRPKNIRIYQLNESIGNFISNTSEVIMILELPERKEEIFAHITSEPARRNMRRALEQEYEVVADGADELLKHFYELYLVKMREFGTPPHGFRFMKSIADSYSDNCVIPVIKLKGEYSGAGLYIQFGEFLYNLYFAVPREFLSERVGYILEYTAMKIALERSLKYIVRGRSAQGSGTYLYKMKLGGRSKQMFIYDFRLTSQGYEAQAVKTMKQKYRIAPGVWSAMPRFITDKFGPFVRKWLY